MFSTQNRIAIIGNDRFAVSIIRRILHDGKYQIAMIIANSQQNFFENIPTYALEEAINEHNAEFDTILIIEEMPYVDEKYFQLHLYNIGEIYILNKESKELFDINNLISESAIQHFDLSKKPLLRYVEFHLVDYCNLNCKGCTHFSNICHVEKRESTVSIDNLERQFKRLKALCDVAVIRLMGGEPLMHPQLEKILPIMRKIFPSARIFLVTNGLLLSKLPPSTFECISANDIYINISLYKPTVAKYKQIKYLLLKYNVVHFWGNGETVIKEEQIIRKFHKCLTAKYNQNNLGYMTCYNKYCWFLKDGKISKCCYPLLIQELNKNFGTEFNVTQNDYIDIYGCANGWDIINYLNKRIPFCNYCSDNIIEFMWEAGCKDAELNDYIV